MHTALKHFMMPALFAAVFLVQIPAVAQSLSGTVYLLKGNQMPSPGRPAAKPRGVSREILIYEPTTAAQADGSAPLFTAIKTKLIAKIKSDSTGHYQVDLPAGTYSVFMAEKGGYFAGESDGDGILNPVVITGKIAVKKDFRVTLNAVF